MNRDDLLELSDANQAEFCREQCRFLPPFHIEEDETLLLTASGTRFPAGPSNCVMPLGSTAPDPGLTLERARTWFAARNRGFSVYVRGHRDEGLAGACEGAGYVRTGDPPGMVLSERLPARALGEGVRIRTVEAGETATAFVDVCARAYETIGMPPDATRKILAKADRWLRPHWHAEVVYDGDEPVAAAMLLFSHGIAGVYWVGTVPEARGRGHGEAVTRSISNRGFERGAPVVVLQASPFGEPIYKRLGYREFTRYPWYLALRQSKPETPAPAPPS